MSNRTRKPSTRRPPETAADRLRLMLRVLLSGGTPAEVERAYATRQHLPRLVHEGQINPEADFENV